MADQVSRLSGIQGSWFFEFSKMRVDVGFVENDVDLSEWTWQGAWSQRWAFDGCIFEIDQGPLYHRTFVIQSKCSCLHEMHQHFLLSDYLDSVNCYAFRRSISRMMLSAYLLEVERDRYHKLQIARERRWCRHCFSANTFVVGDEWHHIYRCPQHCDARTKCIDALSHLKKDGVLTYTLRSIWDFDPSDLGRIWRAFGLFPSSIFKSIELALLHNTSLYLPAEGIDDRFID